MNANQPAAMPAAAAPTLPVDGGDSRQPKRNRRLPHRHLLAGACLLTGCWLGIGYVLDLDDFLTANPDFLGSGPAWQAYLAIIVTATMPLTFLAVAVGVFRRWSRRLTLLLGLYGAFLSPDPITLALVVYLLWYQRYVDVAGSRPTAGAA